MLSYFSYLEEKASLVLSASHFTSQLMNIASGGPEYVGDWETFWFALNVNTTFNAVFVNQFSGQQIFCKRWFVDI